MEPEPKQTDHPETEKLVKSAQTVATRTSEALEPGRGKSWHRFNPNIQVTEDMMWHPPLELTRRKSHHRNPRPEPTWASLFQQVFLGLVEVLVPLVFILGMIYWRAPWLFWAMIRFLRGEPVFSF